ncbi:MAG: thermonuclease family protein [Actinomycetota bacterium]
MRRLVVVAVVLAALAGCGDDDGERTAATVDPAATEEDRPDLGVVVQVLDGDTADIEVQGVVERVRFIGIDTPEPVGGRRDAECFGDEASDLTRRLLPEGTVVRLERDVEGRDVFDRLLAYVFRVDDELFVNLHLAETGYADQLNIEPNSAYAGVIGSAVRSAREQGLGLWGACGSADVPLG